MPIPGADIGWVGYFLSRRFVLHGRLRDHPDRLAVALDEVVHLGGNEVVVGSVRVLLDGLDALQEVLEVAKTISTITARLKNTRA